MLIRCAARAHNGNVIVGGQPEDVNLNRVALAEINAGGDTVWYRDYPINVTFHAGTNTFGIRKIVPTADGGYFCVGYKGDHLQSWDGFALKVNAQGVEEWSQLYGTPGNSTQNKEYFHSAAKVAGGWIMVGGKDANGQETQAWVVAVDEQGNQLWEHDFGGPNNESFYDVVTTDSTHVVAVGSWDAHQAYMVKLDTAGSVIWTQDYGQQGGSGVGWAEQLRSITMLPDSSLVMNGWVTNWAGPYHRAYVLKTSSTGNFLWSRHHGNSQTVDDFQFYHLIPCTDGGFIGLGQTTGWDLLNFNMYGVRMDSLGNVNSNLVQGNVYADYNENCSFDGTDFGLTNWLVKLSGANDTFYISTDTLGRFAFDVDSGAWEIEAIPPNPLWGNSGCQSALAIANFPSFFDTVAVTFPFKADYLCPEMHISVSAPYLRRCFPNRHDVLYCNQGTKVADSVYFDVQFDEWLTVDSASVPWTTALPENTFRWFIDTMYPGDCGSLRVFTTLNCDSTVTGQTHCVEANIYPDTLCTNPPPTWDGAELKIDAECTDDSVHFKISNIGVGDMLSATTYIIVEDDLMIINNSIQLTSGQEFLHSIGGTGPTYRMEAVQTAGYPGYLIPAVTVEGCGVDSNGDFSLGHVITQEMDDRAPWTSIDCRESIASYDPNDKQGFPKGTDSSHFITDSTSLEYLIRFQNTGSDTAFNIVIRDTLSPYLDPLSVQPKVASDPYTYHLENNNVLVFTFANIMLPDSNVNEFASHGYVTFEVQQKPGNPLGTVIENEADIYFDFNPPIITNRTFHTIADSLVEVDLWSVAEHHEPNSYEVRVFPNPVRETVFFEVVNERFDELRLELVDLSGRVVRQKEQSHSGRMSLSRGNLSGGVYLYRLIGDKELVSVGRIVMP